MAESIKNPREEAPEAYIARLRELVERQHVSSARRLVLEARQRFPEDPVLARWQELLSPAKLLGRSPASGVDRSAEIQWLDTYGSDYKGEWLAVSGSRLLGHSRNLQELVSRLESGSSQLRPLLHYIPE
ncbi:MAG TPA: DUF5678 domain-containing protein [Thermoanaerobaculia bacterium]|jgi:hypothetical protein|nr:DUF5678 domain-containing protein [Thermoanaerobaculia bacterium]